jgi:hypothetical protein
VYKKKTRSLESPNPKWTDLEQDLLNFFFGFVVISALLVKPGVGHLQSNLVILYNVSPNLIALIVMQNEERILL